MAVDTSARTPTFTYVDGEWFSGNPPLIGPVSHAMWLGSTVFDGARWFDEKYGEENAKFLYEQLGDRTHNYSRIAYIEMGVEPDDRFECQAREQAAQRNWKFDKLPGDMTLLKRLVEVVAEPVTPQQRLDRIAELIAANHSLEEVRDFLGHSSITVTQKYAHLGAQRLHEAAAATRQEEHDQRSIRTVNELVGLIPTLKMFRVDRKET